MRLRLSSLRAELRRQLTEAGRSKPPRLIVNGYTVPGGKSGLAVRAAIDLLSAHPGTSREDLLSHVWSLVKVDCDFLVSPTSLTTPVGKLWKRERKKSDVIRYYLLPGAEELTGTFHVAQAEETAKAVRVEEEKKRKTLLHLKKMDLAIGDYVVLDPDEWSDPMWRGIWRILKPIGEYLDYVEIEQIDLTAMEVVNSVAVPIEALMKFDGQFDWRPNETLPEDFYSF